MKRPHSSLLQSLYETHFAFKGYSTYLVSETWFRFSQNMQDIPNQEDAQEEKLLVFPYLSLQITIFILKKCSHASCPPITEWNLSPIS